MPSAEPPPPHEAELDALRRRLYRPDASDADRARYDALRSRLETRPSTTAEAPAPRPRPSRRVLLGSALVGALLVVAAVLSATTAPEPAPTDSRLPSSVVTPPAPDPAQATPVAVQVAGEGGAVTGQRFHGVGPAVVPLITGEAPLTGGRLVVVLTADSASPLGWTALDPRSIGSGPSTPRVVASSPSRPRSGIGTPETATYDGAPPPQIAIDARDRTAWELTVLLLRPAT
ncbi:hypothetical protein [Amnibacterium endophyticum]|uniref:Anti-sigma factor n=1 Tax=Amnibacterium endophyticum TaxID=2109337 RepID=A0ABW4LJ72_9MICO